MKTFGIIITVLICISFIQGTSAQSSNDSIEQRIKMTMELEGSTNKIAYLLKVTKMMDHYVDSLNKEVSKTKNKIKQLAAQKTNSFDKQLPALREDLRKKEKLLDQQSAIFDKQLDALDSLTKINQRLGDKYDSLYSKKH